MGIGLNGGSYDVAANSARLEPSGTTEGLLRSPLARNV
jgi:hypothetical protein